MCTTMPGFLKNIYLEHIFEVLKHLRLKRVEFYKNPYHESKLDEVLSHILSYYDFSIFVFLFLLCTLGVELRASHIIDI